MSDYKKTIKDLQDRVKSLEILLQPVVGAAEPKPKKWSPVGGTWHIDTNGIFRNSISTKNRREFGTERSTEAQVERASVEMRRFNRLLALRDELCGDDVVDWSDASSFKYSPEFIAYENRWRVDATRIYHKITVYFSTKESAQRACDMLNSGEVEL